MKAKILILSLICLFIFAYCTSPADPEIKKALNPGNPGNPETIVIVGDDPPVILYFYEEHLFGSTHCLYWSVAETPVATVTASWRSDEVPLISTGSCMTVYETTVYTLTATNAAGQTTESLTIVPKKRAILEITTIPEVPIFHYESNVGSYDTSNSLFTVILTEINGVGGNAIVKAYHPLTGNCGITLYNMIFDPFGNVSHLYGACASGDRPTTMIIKVSGYDDNGYKIKTEVEWPFTWDN